MKRSYGALGLGLLLSGQLAWSAAPATATHPPSEGLEVLDEVLVRGVQPGPALWRVNSGKHTLWILGTVTAIPRGVTWRSRQLEKVLAGSQELLVTGGLIGWGPQTRQDGDALKKVAMLPADQTLHDVLPAELYERVEVARRAFAQREGQFEHMIPFFANMALVDGSMEPLGLRSSGATEAVLDLARNAGVKISQVRGITEDFGRLLQVFASGDTTPCLEETVDLLENKGAGVRALANAWATGKVAELRRLVPRYSFDRINPAEYQCRIAFQGGEQRVQESIAAHRQSWITAAERALESNRTTLAVLPMGELLAADGYVADLRALGYEVVEPP